MTDRKMDTDQIIDRVLRERLEQFNVPIEVRTALRKEIMAVLQRPERKLSGACVMTPEASAAADLARKEGKTQEGGPTPQVS